MNKRMIIMLVFCVVLFGGIFGFKAFQARMMQRHFDHMPDPVVTVSAAYVKQDNWPLILETIGTVKAVNGINVTTEVSGIVETIEFKSGDNIKAGTTLITLSSKINKAELQSLMAAMELAEQELKRYKKLFQQGNISQAELDQKQSQADQAIALVASKREQIAQKTIRAPFDGQLGIRHVDLGQYLSPGSTIVSLQMLDPIYVNFSLPEQYFQELKLNLPVLIQIDAFSEQIFSGKITSIEPNINANTCSFDVQATFRNPDCKLRPGMFANVNIQLAQNKQVLVIPRTAISYNPYGNSVYVLQELTNDKGEKELIAKQCFIKTGREQGDLATVLEGLRSGELVATSGLLKLKNNAKVKINNAMEPSAESDPMPSNS